MSLDEKIWLRQLKDFPQAHECIRQSQSPLDALPSYKYLFALKSDIPKELYAYYLRKLLQFNTANVSVDFRLKMLENVDPNDLMYQEELEAIRKMGPNVVIYRGAPKSEIKPGLSWTLRKDIAESSDFYRGRLFVAQIPSESILLYLSKEEDEEEIIAYVTDNYDVYDDEFI